MKEKMEQVLTKMPKVEQGQKIVLAIDGLSRSGKTTFARMIEQHLKEENRSVCTVHIDDYIVERTRRYHTGNEQWYEYYQLQWDIEVLRERLFKRVRKASELHLLAYDDVADTQVPRKIEIPDTCLIIIEGVFLQRKEWRSYYDYIIYLDCSREERFNRERIDTRNDIEKFEKRYWKAEDYYLQLCSPAQQADLVIQN